MSAFSGVKKLAFGPDDSPVGDDGDPVDTDTCIRLFVNDAFPGRDAGLDGSGHYSYTEAIDVFSGAYSRYNRWRENLAKLAGYPLTADHDGRMMHAAACWNGATGPFSELIDFADNEGVIGPVVAAKLARDFAEWDERAKAVHGEFYEHYGDIRRGCDLAAQGGALNFQ